MAGLRALIVHSDRTGRALYAGGEFTFLTDTGIPEYHGVASWDGAAWERVGSGVAGIVNAFARFDDGRGVELFAAGEFKSVNAQLARWDGRSWTYPASQPNHQVNALSVYDDGSGAGLYAAGRFSHLGTIPAAAIGRWDGVQWSPLGTGLTLVSSTGARCLAVYDDGSGPALYVGGQFSHAGGVPASHIARWDGSSWSAVGQGVGGYPNTFARVDALAVHDDGSGEALYVGGIFKTAGTASVSHVARWDGSAWWDVAGGFSGGQVVNGQFVTALNVLDDGTGPALYAGGHFHRNAKLEPVAGLARLNKANAWEPVGGGMIGVSSNGPAFTGGVLALAQFDVPGPRVFAAGVFRDAGMVPARHIASWDGTAWSRLGAGFNGVVRSFAVHDDGSGLALYAGGEFSAAMDAVALGVARWDGHRWMAVGSGLPGESWNTQTFVSDLREFDDGAGLALYAGGRFLTPTGAPFPVSIAKWEGHTWHPINSPVLAYPRTIVELEVFDDGAGPALYAAGLFSGPLCGVARYDGLVWQLVAVATGNSCGVGELGVFSEGSKPRLFAGGSFSAIGGQQTAALARWTGVTWTGVGGGISSSISQAHPVWDIETHDEGTGRAMFVGGAFDNAGGTPVQGLARWDGTSWSAVGPGQPDSPVFVAEISSGNLARETSMFVAGGFPNRSNGGISWGAGRWQKGQWARLGYFSAADEISDMIVFDDGGGPAVYFGGRFLSAGGVGSAFAASWRECLSCYPDCDDSGTLSVADFTCFHQKFVAGNVDADCNADSALTVADFGCFQTKFTIGCP